jgi:hypothetical protein
MAGQKRYVGKGWLKTFSNGGAVVNISISKKDVTALEADKYGQVHLVVQERRAPDEKSKATHSVSVDDYKHKNEEPF